MFSSSFSDGDSASIYNKSLEIFHLARHLSTYLSQDLNRLGANGSENPHIYISGDIVQQSFSLGPHILKAEEHYFQEEKQKHAVSALVLSQRLYKNCKILQETDSDGKDYVPLMLSEIRRFRKLLRRWLITL